MIPDRMSRDVEDPRIVGWGRMPQRAQRTDTDTIERVKLSGIWQFRWSPTRERADPRTGLWDEIAVPGVWELNGYGTPYYLAFRYPPAIGVRGRRLGRIDPSDTPTGIYRRQLTVPANWAGRRITLRFEGVKSAFHLIVDGTTVGYSEGSMTGATFDLTGRVTPGRTVTLTVVVHRYSTGTYLEDQDMWFLAGITRDVWLEAEPAHAPWDVALTTDFDAGSRTGALRLRIEGGLGGCRVEIDGDFVAEGRIGQEGLTLSAAGLRVRPWSAENPILYDVSVTTFGEDGRSDVRHLRAGFRRIEIDGESLLVNGSPIVLHGVNRHDFHPTRIWDVPADVRERDFALMKRANVNAVRLAHYPNPEQVYRLCDEYGLYVMDEAEMESHGVRRRGIPGDDPAWQPSVIARVEAMVRRSRNHPSVIIWSLGNEAGDGEAFRVAKRAVHALDESRPVHYEGDTTLTTSDVFSIMYPTPQLEQLIGEHRDIRISLAQNVLNALAADDKPFRAGQYANRPVIACEYAHAMQNSFGNAADHVENFHRYPNWAGGFVWDWVDQTIDMPLPSGRIRRAYGGAFGERPSDRWYCANGIVAADRTPHPAYAELAKVYQHVVVTRTPGGVCLTNRHAFDDLAGLLLRWRVERDGRLIAEGEHAEVTTGPGGTREVEFGTPSPDGPGLWVLTVELCRREGTAWAEAGQVTAWEQFELARLARPATPGTSWAVRGTRQRVHLKGEDGAAAEIDARRGQIVSLRRGSFEFLATPLTLNLWRAPTDNDQGLVNFAPALAPLTAVHAWRRANLRARPHRVERLSGGVILGWRVRGAGIRLAVTGAGIGLRLDLTVTAGRHDLIRAGLTGTLNDRFQQVEWVGHGPGENYRDRRTGSPLGRWRSTVGDFPHDYARPQENGNRTGLESLTLHGDGLALHLRRVDGDPFEASVRPYTQEQLFAARYADELPRSGPATLSLDVAHRGVGGDKPGELRLQPQATLARGRAWRCAWILEGVRQRSGPCGPGASTRSPPAATIGASGSTSRPDPPGWTSTASSSTSRPTYASATWPGSAAIRPGRSPGSARCGPGSGRSTRSPGCSSWTGWATWRSATTGVPSARTRSWPCRTTTAPGRGAHASAPTRSPPSR